MNTSKKNCLRKIPAKLLQSYFGTRALNSHIHTTKFPVILLIESENKKLHQNRQYY